MDKAARAALLTAKGTKKKRTGYALGGIEPPKPAVKNPFLREAYFAGPKAKTFTDAPDAYKFTTPDGVTRFEQPDNEARSPLSSPLTYAETARKPNADYPVGGIQKLSDLYQHPTLYKDYPDMANTPVVMLPTNTDNKIDGAYANPTSIAFGNYENIFKSMPEGTMDALYGAPNGAFFINPAGAQRWMDENNASMDQYFRMLFGHETQHWIDNYEKTDLDGRGRKFGLGYDGEAAPYMHRPTEVTAYYVEDRMDLTPEERYGDVQAVSDYLRDNAQWKGKASGGAVGKSKGGALDLARAVMAKDRAGGQIAPSKYLPNVPRQVHAGGGKVDFVKDNPGGDWLAKKQGYAFEYPRMKGIDGAITGWMGGKSDLFLPTHVLKSIEPLNNEKRVAGEPRFDDLMSSVSKEGFDPHQKGNKVVVAVNHRGKPFILEGNTRVAVAHAMGVPSVKAEVRYWNGAEEADGPMHPDQVFGMASDSPDITKAGGGNVEGDNGHIYVVHGGSDFDQIDPSYSGRGEPGNIRPLGNGLYGDVIDHTDPELAARSIEGAKHYARKYGRGEKTLHVFKVPKSSSTVFNGYREVNVENYPKPIEGLGLEPTEELNAYRAHENTPQPPYDPENSADYWAHSRKSTALWNAVKNAADLRMQHLPIGVTEVAIQNPKVATRIGKFSLDTPTSDILDAVKSDVQSRAAGGRVGKFYGGAMGYIPTNWVQAQELAVAKAPRQPQQQQTSTLDTIFQLNELSKMGGTKPTAIAPSPSAASEGHPPTAGMSDAARAAFDALNKGWTGAPISVESAYRDPALNEAVGGAKGSQHLHGNAYDIDTSGWTPEAKLALATQAYNSGFRGFGFYDNNLHFDVGGQRAWGPSYHQDSIPDWAQDWTQQYVYANGGRVGKAGGGPMNGEPNDPEAQAAPARLGDGPQAGGLPDARGVRGSESVLPAPLSPHGGPAQGHPYPQAWDKGYRRA